jgi:hypothetical protein
VKPWHDARATPNDIHTRSHCAGDRAPVSTRAQAYIPVSTKESLVLPAACLLCQLERRTPRWIRWLKRELSASVDFGQTLLCGFAVPAMQEMPSNPRASKRSRSACEPTSDVWSAQRHRFSSICGTPRTGRISTLPASTPTLGTVPPLGISLP